MKAGGWVCGWWGGDDMVLTIDQMGSRWQNGNGMRSELDAERTRRRYVQGRGGLGGVVSTECHVGTKTLYKTLWIRTKELSVP